MQWCARDQARGVGGARISKLVNYVDIAFVNRARWYYGYAPAPPPPGDRGIRRVSSRVRACPFVRVCPCGKLHQSEPRLVWGGSACRAGRSSRVRDADGVITRLLASIRRVPTTRCGEGNASRICGREQFGRCGRRERFPRSQRGAALPETRAGGPCAVPQHRIPNGEEHVPVLTQRTIINRRIGRADPPSLSLDVHMLISTHSTCRSPAMSRCRSTLLSRSPTTRLSLP